MPFISTIKLTLRKSNSILATLYINIRRDTGTRGTKTKKAVNRVIFSSSQWVICVDKNDKIHSSLTTCAHEKSFTLRLYTTPISSAVGLFGIIGCYNMFLILDISVYPCSSNKHNNHHNWTTMGSKEQEGKRSHV